MLRMLQQFWNNLNLLFWVKKKPTERKKKPMAKKVSKRSTTPHVQLKVLKPRAAEVPMARVPKAAKVPLGITTSAAEILELKPSLTVLDAANSQQTSIKIAVKMNEAEPKKDEDEVFLQIRKANLLGIIPAVQRRKRNRTSTLFGHLNSCWPW